MKWTAIHKACWAGDAAEVERLIDAGANPNQVAPTNWRQTPLGRTLEFRITHPKHEGHVEVVRVLLARGANPVARSTYLDMTPHELACFCGLAPAVELLCGFKGAEPHPTGMSPLWIEAASRLPEEDKLPRIRRLLRNADGNQIWRQATPLMMAAAHAGHFRVAGMLLEAGADPNAATSPLHAEWHFEFLIPALDYFARHGWNVHNRGADGRTALHNAALCGYASAVRTLLKLGADREARDNNGFTPLDWARRFRKPAAIKALMA